MSEISTNITRQARKETLNLVGDMRTKIAPPGWNRKNKAKRWSHQDELNTLKGRNVQILAFGTWNEGLLVEADQFALKIQLTGRQSTVTYFKHAIDAYAVV